MTLLTLFSSTNAPFFDVPIMGASWHRQRKQREDDDAEAAMPVIAPPEIVDVGHIPALRPKLTLRPPPLFDVAAALAAAREAARSVAGEEVALRRTERRVAAVAVAQAHARAKAQADAIAQADADEEDDLETILLGGW